MLEAQASLHPTKYFEIAPENRGALVVWVESWAARGIMRIASGTLLVILGVSLGRIFAGSGPLMLGADITLWLLAAAPVIIGVVGVYRGVRDCGIRREIELVRASGKLTVSVHRWFGRIRDQIPPTGSLAIYPYRVRSWGGFAIGVPIASDFIVLGKYGIRENAQAAALRIEAVVGHSVEESQDRVWGTIAW